MKNPSVSVIVPLYNVEPYIAQCLESLVTQDFDGVEIVVVDDGSPDHAVAIAEQYCRSYKGMQIVRQSNQGLSAARNAGLKIARGEFVGFVDGDDFVHAGMYGSMCRHARATGADLVLCHGYLYNDRTRELRPRQDEWIWAQVCQQASTPLIDPVETADLFLIDTSACMRLYRRSFLDRLDFEFAPGTIFEDVLPHYNMLFNTTSAALLDQPFYFYRTEHAGRITGRRDTTLMQIFTVFDGVLKLFRTHRADDRIWANFVWYQNWVMRWLRQQIPPEVVPEFDRAAIALGQRFPETCLALFKQKFRHDTMACEFVELQLSGRLRGDHRA